MAISHQLENKIDYNTQLALLAAHNTKVAAYNTAAVTFSALAVTYNKAVTDYKAWLADNTLTAFTPGVNLPDVPAFNYAAPGLYMGPTLLNTELISAVGFGKATNMFWSW